MRILVLGAGALGGYFGARLLAAGRDVHFLVRPARAARLREGGLRVRSPAGDLDIAAPPLLTDATGTAPFDVVLLSCKAYDLDSSIAAITPAMGPSSLVLPLLNGLSHLDRLDAAFGAPRVLGGQCIISATLDADGTVLHLAPMQSITFGGRDDATRARAETIAAQLGGAGFAVQASPDILQEMWEKWSFIATLAASTCLMRAQVGDIMAAGGEAVLAGLRDECAAIAAAHGHPLREPALARSRDMMAPAHGALKASMARDIERGAPIEAEHVLGDLLRRGGAKGVATPLLQLAVVHVRAYEVARKRAAT
jgi:2-dehydropantoate 2-reductase